MIRYDVVHRQKMRRIFEFFYGISFIFCCKFSYHAWTSACVLYQRKTGHVYCVIFVCCVVQNDEVYNENNWDPSSFYDKREFFSKWNTMETKVILVSLYRVIPTYKVRGCLNTCLTGDKNIRLPFFMFHVSCSEYKSPTFYLPMLVSSVNSSRCLLFFELGSQFQVREYKIAQSLPSLPCTYYHAMYPWCKIRVQGPYSTSIR